MDYKAKKIYYNVSQAPPFPVFRLKVHLYIVNCRFKLAINWRHFVWFFDNQLVAANTESQKFAEITRLHRFYSMLLKKNKK